MQVVYKIKLLKLLENEAGNREKCILRKIDGNNFEGVIVGYKIIKKIATI